LVVAGGGSWRLNTETLPWHERYGGFVGTLPNIVDVLTNNTSFVFEMNILGIQCRMSGGTVNRDLRRNTATRALIEHSLEGRNFRSSINEGLCGTLEVRTGTGNTVTAATVTLI
jgi:hypothetical protein